MTADAEGSVVVTRGLGPLMIIGGGARPELVVSRLLTLAGGAEAVLVVVPAASVDPPLAGRLMVEEFSQAGARDVEVIALDRKGASNSPGLEALRRATGIYFTGGDQSRLRQALAGTEFLDEVRKLRERGGLVAGSSAGAAVMGDLMPTGAEVRTDGDLDAFSRLVSHNVETAGGFGFWPGVIVDQHFVARRRNNRLLSLVLDHPHLVGVGIDESTAVVVPDEGPIEVVGSGAVLIYDARDARDLDAGENGTQSARGVRLHILHAGQTIDLELPGWSRSSGDRASSPNTGGTALR